MGALDAIDKFWDRIDDGIDAVDRVLNRHQRTEQKIEAHRPKKVASDVIDAEVVPPQTAIARSPAAKKPCFRIVERYSDDDRVIFVVTDGRHATAECPSRESAEQLLGMLEKMSEGAR